MGEAGLRPSPEPLGGDGGTNLAGMPVTINGEHFLIGGVVARETDFATERAYPGDGGVYMSFSAMKRLNDTSHRWLRL